MARWRDTARASRSTRQEAGVSEFETVPEPRPAEPIRAAGADAPPRAAVPVGVAAERTGGGEAGPIGAAFERGMAAAASARGAARQAARRRQRGGTVAAGAMALIAAMVAVLVGTAGVLRSAAGHPGVAIGHLEAARPQVHPGSTSAASLPTSGGGELGIWHGEADARAPATLPPAPPPPPAASPAPVAPALAPPPPRAAPPVVVAAAPRVHGHVTPVPGSATRVSVQPPAIAESIPAGSPFSPLVTFTVENTGTAVATVGGVRTTVPAFAITRENCSGASLASGDMCHITVQFRPPARGHYAGQLVVAVRGGATSTARLEGDGR